jgi:hypothetical protein
MKKRVLTIILAILIISSLVPLTALASNDVTVDIDGQHVAFQGQGPVIVGGRTLVPVRGVFEAVGFAVGWNGATQTVTLTNDAFTVIITVGSSTFTTNGVGHTLDVPAQIMNGRTMLPIRLPLESVGIVMSWDGATRTVGISTETAIKRILGVDYTIQQREYTYTDSRGTFRWQFLDLLSPVDTSDLRQNSGGGIVPSNTGDVFILTFPNGETYLHVDIGEQDVHGSPRRFHITHIRINLNPAESFDWLQYQQELETAEQLARLGMAHHYTSPNFYWYSRAESARWLPDMARGLEIRLAEIADSLGITLTQRIPVYYYDRDDFEAEFPHFAGTSPQGYPGFAGERGIFTSRPRGSTTATTMMIGHLAHELVHVIQAVHVQTDWESMDRLGLGWLGWVTEGTATFVGHGRELYMPVILSQLRRQEFPSLDSLSDNDRFFAGGGWENYCWAATIFEFIVETYGMEHLTEMNRRHGDFQGIFGISRSEFERQWHQYLRTLRTG